MSQQTVDKQPFLQGSIRTPLQTVICGGLATDYCVKNTVLQLKAAGFDVILNKAACRGIAPDTLAAAIEEMAAAGVKFVECTAELEAQNLRKTS